MATTRAPLGALAAAAALAGCVSVQEVPMSTASFDALRGRELSLAARDKPDFGAMTAGKAAGGALFGALGGAIAGNAMVSAGNELVAQNGIHDPAEQIGNALGSALGGRYATKATAFRTRLSTDEPTEVSKTPNGADVVLDVRTINWGFVYFPTSWSKYRVMYSARARLLDARKGQVLAESGCALPLADNADAAPSYEEVVANGAAWLKGELQRAADYCAGQFATKMFSLTLAAAARAKVAETPAAPAPLARVQEQTAVATAGSRAGSLPPVGSRWSYSIRDRLFKTDAHAFAVELAQSDGAAITEVFSAADQQRRLTSKADDIGFLPRRIAGQRLLELSPYLLAYTAEPTASAPRAPATYPFGGAARDWQLQVTAVTRERVTVPAGVFDAVRINITGETPVFRNDLGIQRFVYTVWYAPSVGRYVQSRHQTFDRRGMGSGDEWVELTKFEAPGAR